MGGPGSGPKKGQKWAGAPTKLTQQLFDEIIRLIEVGNYFETACHACGVPAITGRNWLRKGANAKSKDGLYARFVTAYKKAEAKAEASAIVRIRTHSAKAWQADAWYLERKFPKKWGRGEWRNHDGPGGLGTGKDSTVSPAVKIYIPSNGRDDDDGRSIDDSTDDDE